MSTYQNQVGAANPSLASRVRTGNKKPFDYDKDPEVTCRFGVNTSREEIYKEIQKVKWPLNKINGFVLRPDGLVDFS